MPVLTLTTDFGMKDGFVGTLKGVILGICPNVQIVDISHDITSQNIKEGAITLWRAYPYFPAGTIHVAVIDPGVGTGRRAIALMVDGHYFVGPDNGIFTPVIQDISNKKGKMIFVELRNAKYFLNNPSNTFHGRDIFSPVGAHLAKGVRLIDLGPTINDPILLPWMEPEKVKDGWIAHISYIDKFGNCTTNLPSSEINKSNELIIRICGKEIRGLSVSYGHQKPGDLIALIDSEGFLEVALVNGNAANHLKAHVDDRVVVVQK
jgi:S-adenosyl-L-methionine hydrolase (adenosine-forming)